MKNYLKLLTTILVLLAFLSSSVNAQLTGNQFGYAMDNTTFTYRILNFDVKDDPNQFYSSLDLKVNDIVTINLNDTLIGKDPYNVSLGIVSYKLDIMGLTVTVNGKLMDIGSPVSNFVAREFYLYLITPVVNGTANAFDYYEQLFSTFEPDISLNYTLQIDGDLVDFYQESSTFGYVHAIYNYDTGIAQYLDQNHPNYQIVFGDPDVYASISSPAQLNTFPIILSLIVLPIIRMKIKRTKYL